MTTETKVEAVAITRYHEELSGMVAGPALYEEQTEYVLYADHVSAITALKGEVAENEGVIRVWRRRCEEAERLLDEVREIQRSHYGDGVGLHLAMIRWARECDALTKETP
jgi:hypothetical protein